MTDQLSLYEIGVTLRANVPNSPNQTQFFGTVAVVDRTGPQVTEQTYTPAWVKPATSEAEACAILIQYVRPVLKRLPYAVYAGCEAHSSHPCKCLIRLRWVWSFDSEKIPLKSTLTV